MNLRKGNQTPTFSTVGEWATSEGDYACDLFEQYGVTFYGSQRHEMRVFLARDESGSYSALTICVSKPRQNGKSFAAQFYAIWSAAIEGKHVLFSAHHGKTVRAMFKAIRNFVEGTPDFAALLLPNGKGVYAAAGTEGIYFTDVDGNAGGCIEFQTRTNNAARGETYQVIVIDEAQELTAEQLEAIKPTTIAADDASKRGSDPQMIYLGTPPNAKCIGTEFRRWHDEAHSGGSGIWWLEWAVDEIPLNKTKAEILELVYLTNPAMGYRIKERTMLDMMDTMSIDGFARECLGWWSATASVRETFPIDVASWKACEDKQPTKSDQIAYAVKFSADGAIGVLAECHKGDKPFVFVKDARSMASGLSWFVDTLESVARSALAIVIDGQANAQELTERLLQRNVPPNVLKRPKTGDCIAAYSGIANAVKEGVISHFGQPALDDSATKTVKRSIGTNGGWGFRSTDEADAALIEACALAYWGAMNSKRNPKRKAVVF